MREATRVGGERWKLERVLGRGDGRGEDEESLRDGGDEQQARATGSLGRHSGFLQH